jgi:hypothetical protein
MTYELAKKLKDAGFSQEPKIYESLIYFYNKKEILITPDMIEFHRWVDMVKNPTLPELIEACGEGIFHLYNSDIIKNGWHAQLTNEKDTISCCNSKAGSLTPEEAVANLWLELTKRI